MRREGLTPMSTTGGQAKRRRLSGSSLATGSQVDFSSPIDSHPAQKIPSHNMTYYNSYTHTFQATETPTKTFSFAATNCGLLCGDNTHSGDPCDPTRQRIRWFRESENLTEDMVDVEPEGNVCNVCRNVWVQNHSQAYRADGMTSWTDYAKDLGADRVKLEQHKKERFSVIEKRRADHTLPITTSSILLGLTFLLFTFHETWSLRQAFLDKKKAKRPDGVKSVAVTDNNYKDMCLRRPDDDFWLWDDYLEAFGDPKSKKNKKKGHQVCVLDGHKGVAVPSGEKGPWKIEHRAGGRQNQEKQLDC